MACYGGYRYGISLQKLGKIYGLKGELNKSVSYVS